MSQKDYETEHLIQLKTDEQQKFNADVIKTVRYLIRRMQDEPKKHWTPNAMVGLLDQLIDEIEAGITVEDIERSRVIKVGERAFKAGQQRAENPFDASSKEYGWWDSGWHDIERQHQDGTQIQTGRQKEAKKVGRYLVQAIIGQHRQEWNDTLHMWMDAGNGTRLPELAEAQMLANSLKPTVPDGKIGVVDILAKSTK